MRRALTPLFASRPPIGKGVLCALSGLLALAQILTFAHFASTSHQVCAEHGEIAHAGREVSEPKWDDLAGARVAAASPAEHGHEHCLCKFETRERFLLPEPIAGETRLAFCPGDPLGVPAPWPIRPCPIFAFAPKGSPPVRVV